MAAPDRNAPRIKDSEQNVLNDSFDETYGVLVFQPVGYDGQNVQRNVASALATKITTSGSDTYVGEAAPGTSQATAKWRIQKIDTNGNITWKDGDANFDNTATDLTTGSFS